MPQSVDWAAREARVMAERLASEGHDAAHASMTARIARDLGHGRPRPAIRGDHGSGAILMAAACVPLILAIVYVVSSLAGAISGIAAAGGAS